ncbi:hypothetical protein RJ640_021505 [Escallonia rubra]|uniref:Chromo domain-containing protein n=1 Tax=Escallonia rubra TaxID=112253 RepID=A0AA88U2K3_9ASTE|nr:hypothetical protein RJ640_021505 [Escallonia rubra]
MAERDGIGVRGRRGRNVTVDRFEELKDQVQNLTQLVTQLINNTNHENDSDNESDRVRDAANEPNHSTKEESDNSSDGRRPELHRGARNNRGHQGWEDRIVHALQNSKEYGVQVHIVEFDGDMEPEGFLDWMDNIESFFDWKEVLEGRKVKLVGAKLRGPASAWWKHYQNDRDSRRKAKIQRWDKMKEKLKAQFLPRDYDQTLYQRVQNLWQHEKTVKEYTQEFHKLSLRSNLVETESQKVSRYVNGLRLAIQDQVSLQRPYKVSDAYQLALKVEIQLTSSSSRTLAYESNNNASTSRANNTTRGGRTTSHMHPQQQTNTKGEDHVDACESNVPDEEGIEGDVIGEALVIRHSMLAPPANNNQDDWLRNKIFRTRCTVEGKLCNLIIDSGSSENLISQVMVDKLKLKIERHPQPYRILWFNKGNEDTLAYAENLKEVQEEVQEKLAEMNQRYKEAADRHRRFKEFKVGKFVMVFFRKERLPKGTYHKLKNKKVGPCKILWKFGDNAYEVELPRGLVISHIFNVADIYTFYGDTHDELGDVGVKTSSEVSTKQKKRVARVIDVREIKIRAGAYLRFLVKWAGQPDYQNSWLSDNEFMKIDHEMCQVTKMATRTEASSF